MFEDLRTRLAGWLAPGPAPAPAPPPAASSGSTARRFAGIIETQNAHIGAAMANQAEFLAQLKPLVADISTALRELRADRATSAATIAAQAERIKELEAKIASGQFDPAALDALVADLRKALTPDEPAPKP